MPAHADRIDSFLNKRAIRKKVGAALRSAGFQPSAAVEEHPTGQRGALFLRLNPDLRELFGTGREVLAYIADYDEYQARSVMRAMEVLEQNRPRLCEDFALIFTADAKTPQHVGETELELPVKFIGFGPTEIAAFKPQGDTDFTRALQQRLYTEDLYQQSNPIRTAASFFGREGLLSELASGIKQGRSHIGLFGLRKIGKTSFLYRLKDRLINMQAAHVAHVDVQRLDAVNPTGEYFLWSLGEAIYDSHRAIRKVNDYRLFGHYDIFADIRQPQSVWELFARDLKLALFQVRRPIVIAIDEIELASPSVPGSRWGDHFVRIWRLLRGLDQENPGRLRFFVTGTNPACMEAPSLAGEENPVYNYFKGMYMPPFSRDECLELLTTLGPRMGLNWSGRAIDELFRQVGGHPYLLRSYASLVHKTLLPRDAPKTVNVHHIKHLVPRFLMERSSVLSQIVGVLIDYYPSELEILNSLSKGRVQEYREFAAAFPEDTGHLVGYGLVDPDLDQSTIRMEVLQTWLQREERRVQKGRATDQGGGLATGTVLNDYTLQAAIGRPGGYARCYLAVDNGGGRYAVKVLRRGSIAKVQREVEALQMVDHPAIVKFSDYGVTPDGFVYLVMEHLDGPTLRAYCERSSRLSPDVLKDTASKLLSALVAMHPQLDKVAQAREREVLDAASFADVMEARHGIIHRDIKPDNVVMVQGRGPVLIDFNISISAAAPVTTISATPGYLPPDFNGVRWSPEVDLYQLGLTLAQVAAGVEFDGDNAEDIRTILLDSAPSRVAYVISRLFAAAASDRYPSAESARKDLLSA